MEVAFNKVKESSRSDNLKKTHNETSENKSPLPACKNTPYARDILRRIPNWLQDLQES